VTEAIYDYWQYWEPIRIYGPQGCIYATQQFVQVIDGILIDHKDNTSLAQDLKNAFGLGNITYNNDFAYTLAENGIGTWQGRNWDPAVNDPSFSYYCGNISSTSLLYPGTESLRSSAETLIKASGRISSPSATFTTQLLNFIGWANTTLVASCTQTQDQCYSTHNSTYYAQIEYSTQTWRSWSYQFCTQWGFYQTGSGVPPAILPLLSRTIDLEYSTIVCREAFNVSGAPDTQSVNQYGGFGIEAERLAIIDGEADPWRYATPHAPEAPKRDNTINRPFWEIPQAVHHWDENGLFPNETTVALPPSSIKDVQAYEVQFVKAWVEEYQAKGGYGWKT
jgi:Serine carboxypeptidase S28